MWKKEDINDVVALIIAHLLTIFIFNNNNNILPTEMITIVIYLQHHRDECNRKRYKHDSWNSNWKINEQPKFILKERV